MPGRPWRILFLVFNQTGTGTYWRAYHFGRCLAARGHVVTLMTTSPRARLRSRQAWNNGVCLVEMPDLLPGPLRSGWDPWATARRANWLAGRQFDIVHAFEARPTVLFPALLAQRRGAKLVMDWCDWLGRGGSLDERPNRLVRAVLGPIETFFEEHFRTRASGTTVINTVLRDKALALGVRSDTIALIRNGSTAQPQVLSRSEARRKLGLSMEAVLIGYAGRAYDRDAQFMFGAFRILRTTMPEAQLILAGSFNRALVTGQAESAAIVRTGPITAQELDHYLAACDVCWLPLANSGANRGRWPLKLNDYMASARPTVATAVGDLGEVFARYQLGVVTAPDELEFARETANLLCDTARRDRLGEAAHRAAQTVFSWTHITDDLESLYRRILG